MTFDGALRAGFPIIGPESRGVRFGVGGPTGPKSSVWRAWVNRDQSDLYIGARQVAGTVRVSLHASGRWRFAFTPRISGALPPGVDRAREKWDRPPPFVPGVTMAFQVLVPTSELKEASWMDDGKPKIWVLPPPAAQMSVFSFLLADPGTPLGSWPGRDAMHTRLLWRRGLPSGEELFFTVHSEPVPEANRAQLETYRSHLEATAAPYRRARGDQPLDLRGFLFGVQNGVGTFIDVSLP